MFSKSLYTDTSSLPLRTSCLYCVHPDNPGPSAQLKVNCQQHRSTSTTVLSYHMT
ncbi:mCG148200 [Mus musculus]|nr:mCG148200 [Mus musculus]